MHLPCLSFFWSRCVFVCQAVLLMVVTPLISGAFASTASAQEPNMSQPFVLELRELESKQVQDNGNIIANADDTYLVVGSRKVWKGSMWKGQRRPVSDQYTTPIVFQHHIEIKLMEEDSGLNFGDDDFGTWPVYWDDFDGRTDPNDEKSSDLDQDTVRATFDEDGGDHDDALYYLTYKVRPATQADLDAAGFCESLDGSVPEGVYLHEHNTTTGRCTRLTQDVANLKPSWVGNDSVTSVLIIGCYTATLYEHTDYRGTTREVAASIAHVGKPFNDRASSVKIQRHC